jgi:hypothetical protein
VSVQFVRPPARFEALECAGGSVAIAKQTSPADNPGPALVIRKTTRGPAHLHSPNRYAARQPDKTAPLRDSMDGAQAKRAVPPLTESDSPLTQQTRPEVFEPKVVELYRRLFRVRLIRAALQCCWQF